MCVKAKKYLFELFISVVYIFSNYSFVSKINHGMGEIHNP